MIEEQSNCILQLESVSKAFGNTSVLSDVNLTVNAGDFYVLSGQPSSGKSVLLRLILGLESPDTGAVFLRGQDVTDDGPEKRNIGYVPQSFALFPNKSVRENITYPLRLDKASKAVIDETVTRVSDLLKITDLLEKNPNQLSGGQKQRVAIARGLAKETDLFVLDDPLVGLDFKLRERLIDDLRKTRAALGVTFVYSTSDSLEALLLASRVGVLSHGTIMEEGELSDIYDEPQTTASMATLGFPAVNFVEGRLNKTGEGSVVDCALGEFRVMETDYEGQVVLGVRPEHIDITRVEGGTGFQARVLFTEDVGGSEIVYVESNGVPLVLVLGASNPLLAEVRSGAFMASIRPENVVVFNPDSFQRITHGKDLVNV